MAEASNEIGKIKIHGILSFEHLFKKSSSIDGGPEKYRANFIIDPTSSQGKKDIGQIENAIDDLIDDTWKGKKPKLKEDRNCFMDGNDMLDRDGNVRNGYEDMMYIKASSDKKPKLRARNGEDEVLEEDDLLYSGAHVIGYLRLFAITDPKKGGNGIFCSIDGVQFVKHGEKFGGGGMSDDEFERMNDDGDDDRPARRSRSRDEDDDRPARRSRSRDEDEDAPPARRSRSRDEDDDRPARRSRDEDDRPSRRSRDEDDNRSSRRSRDEDDDRPARRSRDEDDDRSSRRRSRDEDEDRPSRRSRDEEDDRPARRSRSRDEI